MSALDRVKARLESGEQTCPYDEHMGFRFRLQETDRGRTVIDADVDERFHNPNGVTHGGLLAGLADSVMGSTMFTLLGDDETCTNVDLSIKYLRATVRGRLRGEGAVLKEGRTTCVVEARITDPEGRLVARAESTFLRLPVGRGGSPGRDRTG